MGNFRTSYVVKHAQSGAQVSIAMDLSSAEIMRHVLEKYNFKHLIMCAALCARGSLRSSFQFKISDRKPHIMLHMHSVTNSNHTN